MIFVTPDGERSMNTYLGACVELGPEDVEADKAAGAKVTYFEGYLWDPPRAKEAIRLTADHAHAAGREVSMTLSDPFCVDRYRDEFLDLMRSGTVDIVFANEPRDQVALPDLVVRDGARRDPQGLQDRRRDALGEGLGDRARRRDGRRSRRSPIKELVDTTGAGDLYAAGFLYGYTAGRDLQRLRRSRLAGGRAGDPADRPAPAPESAPGSAERRGCCSCSFRDPRPAAGDGDEPALR